MAPTPSHQDAPRITLSRRALLGGAAATLAASALPGADAAHRAGQSPAPPESPASWLVVVPDSGDTGSVSGEVVAIYAPSGAEVARLNVPRIDMALHGTGNPKQVLARTRAGARLITLDPPGISHVTGDALLPDLSPQDARGDYGAAHPGWAVIDRFQPAESGTTQPAQVVLVRLDRATGVDIWPRIGDNERYPLSDYRFSASGAWLTAWDDAERAWTTFLDTPTIIDRPAWLVPTADPAAARVLGAGRGRSTAAVTSPSGRLVACTAFDPETLLGAIVVEPVEGGDAVELAPANMWGRSIWLSGDTDRLVTFGHGEVALHELDSAGSATSTVLARGEPIADRRCGISADGRRALYGSRPEPEGPLAWQWIDLDRGEARSLPALERLRRERTSGVNVWPRWLLFGPDTRMGYDPLVGLDMETGETRPLVELMQPPDRVATSADGRFTLLATEWDSPTPARLVDAASGTVTPLWAARSQMVRSGVVSPDGSRAAIHAVGNADHDLEVLLIDTTDPAAMQALSPGAAVLWTGEIA